MLAKRRTSASGFTSRLATTIARGAGVLACVVLLSSGANAATVFQSFVEPGADTGVPPATIISGTVFEGATGSVADVRRSPWEGTSIPDGTYTAVTERSSATYDFGEVVYSGVSFMWGSVDTYNTLEFLDGNTVVDTVFGGDLIPPATQGLGFSVVTIFADFLFDAVRFSSDANSFEYANLTAIPVPPALPLFGTGLLALFYLRRRSRRRATAVAA